MFTRLRPSLFKILPFIILIILVFTYRDVLRSMVLVPLAYLIFFFRLVAGSIGQETLWIAFVVLSSIVALISLAMRPTTQPEDTAVEIKYPTRLQTWQKTINRKERSEFFKWNMAQDLSNLFVDAIAYHQGISRDQVIRQLWTGDIDLPPDILKYIQISQKPFSHSGLNVYTSRNRLVQIWKSLIKRSSISLEKSPLDIEPVEIIMYLHEYLNINPETWEG